jgi:two-component system, chemotaxis family, protein-glutamate methylesterase/glutaminase
MHPIVVIAASAGGLPPLRYIAAALPTGCTASVFVVFHIGSSDSHLPEILNFSGIVPAAFAENETLIEAGRIYVAPPDRHMLLQPGRIHLNREAKVHYTRPAADPLFISAAHVYGEQVMGVVLSGGDGDGAEGLRIIKKYGGVSLVQAPEEAWESSMPYKALLADHPTPFPIEEIARRVRTFCT